MDNIKIIDDVKFALSGERGNLANQKRIVGASKEIMDQSIAFITRLKSGERAETVLDDVAVFFHNQGIIDGVTTLLGMIETKRDVRSEVKREIGG